MDFRSVIILMPLWLPALIALGLLVRYFTPYLIEQFTNQLTLQTFEVMLISAPFWLPILLAAMCWKTWRLYVRSLYLYKLDWILLEIKLPQDVFKSPLAMETFLMSLHQTGGETTFIDRNWKGQVRAHWSLEIVSIEGQIKFFIYAQKKYRNLIESGLYAHYPGIEIYETPDYTHSVHFDPKETALYVIDYKLKNPDCYPIKTYVDYGIDDENVEEEAKIDPINGVLEYMGSIGKNQQVWLQIIIKAHKGDQHKAGTLFGQTDTWKEEAKKEVEKIRSEALPKGSEDLTKFPNPTKGQQERIAAIERSVSKIPFDTGIRAIYFGKKEFFNGANITGLRTLLRSYSAPHLNVFGPTNWCDGYDYPWEDFMGIRQDRERREGLEAYKRRSFFYQPFIGESYVMTVEEIATMFHLPGRVAQTPTLNRVVSKKAEAPSNLPI